MDLSLPIVQPVPVFTIVLFVIFFAPLLFNKIKIPGIIGLIVAGILLGPKGFYILENDTALKLFGKVGLLYIMFLAGLEIDLKEFKKNSNKSLVFGALTFAIPMILGYAASYYFLYEYLDISITGVAFSDKIVEASILLASMFASHTLLVYPIVSRYGLLKNESVTVAVGGTIITDTLALLVLTVMISSTAGSLDSNFWLRLGVSLVLYSAIVFIIFPWISRWFFRKVESEGVYQYIYTLAIVFSSAMLAEAAGIEAIIGAFSAGLALNRLVPHSSALMNRIEFIGNALFIPFFLISVGMLVDYRVLFSGTEALIIAAVMIVVANVAKFAAAYITQKIYGYNANQRNIIFGLSNAQAAATLAAVLIAYDIGLLNDAVLNGTILMILVTCLISSLVAERASKKQATLEATEVVKIPESPEKIMVPISNPENVDRLIDFAILIYEPKTRQPIYPLAIIKDDSDVEEQLIVSKKMLDKVMIQGAASNISMQMISRVDLNFAGGIVRAAKELSITDLVLGWNGKITTAEFVFGSVLDQILMQTNKSVYVTKIIHPVSTIKKIILAVPPDAHLEYGFDHWIRNIKRLAKQTSADIKCMAPKDLQAVLRNKINVLKPSVGISFKDFEDWEDFLDLSREMNQDDLFVVVKARADGPSYNKSFDKIPKFLARYFEHISFVVIYPEQREVGITVQQALSKSIL